MRLRNAQAAARDKIPALPISGFRSRVVEAVNKGARIAALFYHEGLLLAVLAHDEEGLLEALSSRVKDAYPALTPD